MCQSRAAWGRSAGRLRRFQINRESENSWCLSQSSSGTLTFWSGPLASTPNTFKVYCDSWGCSVTAWINLWGLCQTLGGGQPVHQHNNNETQTTLFSSADPSICRAAQPGDDFCSQSMPLKLILTNIWSDTLIWYHNATKNQENDYKWMVMNYFTLSNGLNLAYGNHF